MSRRYSDTRNLLVFNRRVISVADDDYQHHLHGTATFLPKLSFSYNFLQRAYCNPTKRSCDRKRIWLPLSAFELTPLYGASEDSGSNGTAEHLPWPFKNRIRYKMDTMFAFSTPNTLLHKQGFSEKIFSRFFLTSKLMSEHYIQRWHQILYEVLIALKYQEKLRLFERSIPWCNWPSVIKIHKKEINTRIKVGCVCM